MNWRRIHVSPPPTTSWLLDMEVVAAIRRDPKGELHCAAEAMPPGACEIGPVGLQVVHRERLAPILNAVQGRIEGARRAAVVVPTGWVRAHLLGFSELPRRQTELGQIVLWRLKKLLPVLPSELRVATTPVRPVDGQRRLLCMVGVERAVAELEAAFATVGVEPGLITPRLFALGHGRHAGTVLLVQQEAGFLSLLLLVDDSPLLLRTKQVGVETELIPGLTRELHITELYIRSDLGIDGPITVVVSGEHQPLREGLRSWWSERPGIVLAPPPAERRLPDPELAGRLGDARLLPLLSLIGGDPA